MTVLLLFYVHVHVYIIYLPDRVSVLARVSSAPEHWHSTLLPEVVDTHSAIIQPRCQEVRVGGVDVQTQDTSGGGVDEPGREEERKREERGERGGEGGERREGRRERAQRGEGKGEGERREGKGRREEKERGEEEKKRRGGGR